MADRAGTKKISEKEKKEEEKEEEKEDTNEATEEITKAETQEEKTETQEEEKEEEKKIPKCIVYFRPDPNPTDPKLPKFYNGEFGFDWLRTGIPDNSIMYKSYKDIIVACHGKDSGTDLEKQQKAYTAFKNEYKTTDKPIKGFETIGRYHIPYLNIFSKTYSDSAKIKPLPPYKATLRVWVKIEDADVDKIQLEFNKDIFMINENQSGEFELSKGGSKLTTMSPSLQLSDEINITCLEEITKDEEIVAYAYFKDSKGEEKKELAGKLNVCKNDKTVREEVKIVLVCVRTKIISDTATGTISPDERLKLKNILYQALVCPTIEDKRKNEMGIEEDIVLNLSDNPKFKKGRTKRGIYISAEGNIDTRNIIYFDTTDGIWKQPIPVLPYLRQKFKKENPAYRDYIPVFAFGGDFGDDGTLLGRAESIGGEKSFAAFHQRLNYDHAIMTHELLHCFGLRHTFRDGTGIIDDSRQKYIFKDRIGDEATDNVMTYNWGNLITTWKWQWEIIKKHIR